MKKISSPSQAFAKNRAEELGFDLWNEFIVPLYFDRLNLAEVRKPLVFEGGRGCGKTTLLRYLCYSTQLSEKRSITPEQLPKEIGLYLRADTQYLRAFRGDSLTAQNWERAFEHELCLSITSELLNALKSLTVGPQRARDFAAVINLQFMTLKDIDEMAPTDLEGLIAYIAKLKTKLAYWLNNADTQQRPSFLPMKSVFLGLINSLRQQISYFNDTVFFVFVDEYENLLEYQMQVINTYLKHSEDPLIFHIATKRNGMLTRATVGNERLQERDDFRKINVEDLNENDFLLFAAELFCSRMRKKGFEVGPQVLAGSLLYDVDGLEFRRRNETYRNETIAAVRDVLPDMSKRQAADFVLNDVRLRKHLQEATADALRLTGSAMDADKLLRSEAPMESICIPALLYQGKRAEDLSIEMNKVLAGLPTKFTGWSHSYFTGSLFYLFLPLQRPCVMYGGLDSFLALSKGNTRHFLELCFLSLAEAVWDVQGGMKPISVERQAEAARTASAKFVKESQGSGDDGNRLFHVVNALGQIFRIAHSRPSQSEAEVTHFAVNGGVMNLEAIRLLDECVKWSILFTAPETKVKAARLEAEDYVFNPIYAPYFGISFRKGRKLEFSGDQLSILMHGSHDAISGLVKSFERKWRLDVSDQPSLFEGSDHES